jgi:hypothetical protein
MSLISTDSTETALPLELIVNSLNIGGVAGLTCTVAVRNISAGGPPYYYLDWADLVFRTSGWTTQFQTMTSIGSGLYEATLNVAALNLPPGVTTKLSAEYRSFGNQTSGEGQDVILVNNVAAQVTLLRKFATNRLEEASGNPGTLTLYDDDAATVIEQFSLLDEFGNAVSPAVGTPAKRSAGTP